MSSSHPQQVTLQPECGCAWQRTMSDETNQTVCTTQAHITTTTAERVRPVQALRARSRCHEGTSRPTAEARPARSQQAGGPRLIRTPRPATSDLGGRDILRTHWVTCGFGRAGCRSLRRSAPAAEQPREQREGADCQAMSKNRNSASSSAVISTRPAMLPYAPSPALIVTPLATTRPRASCIQACRVGWTSCWTVLPA